MTPNIVIFTNYDQKFGQGAFNDMILQFTKMEFNLAVVKINCKHLTKIAYYIDNGIKVIELPELQKGSVLTAENNRYQKMAADRIISLVVPFLKNCSNLLFWANSIDFLNIFSELKNVFDGCKLLYVHHSFSWKYFKNVPDLVFQNEWKNRNFSFHPKSFEMTEYQQNMAMISDVTITVTDHAKSFFINALDIPLEKIHTIYNGIPIPETSENRALLREKYGINQSDIIILFSGRITYDKGYPHLLKAFKLVADKNKDVRLIIAGSGKIFEHISVGKPHWNKIIFTGELSKQEIQEFYQLADIGVIPSLHEQCSFTAIEMRLYKLPMIVTAVDGLDELFSHEVDSIKVPIRINADGNRTIDENQLSSSIERLVENKILRNRIVANSYKIGLDRFSAEIMVSKYIGMVKCLLASPQSHTVIHHPNLKHL